MDEMLNSWVDRWTMLQMKVVIDELITKWMLVR